MRRITSEIDEPDQRVAELKAERHERRAGDHGQRDEAVGAGVVAVGDQRGASRRARRAAGPGRRARYRRSRSARAASTQRCRGLRVHQPVDRLDRRDAGADEDRGDDEVAGAPFSDEGAEQEGDPSGMAVSASPKLCRGRPAARAAGSTKIAACASAVASSTARLIDTARRPVARAGDRAVDQPVAVPVRRPCVIVVRVRAHAGCAGRAVAAAPRRRCSTWPTACVSSSATWWSWSV